MPIEPVALNAIMLPDAKGGFREVDDTYKKIKHGSSVVKVRQLTDKKKFWRRTFRGVIVFVICAAILLAAFFLLR